MDAGDGEEADVVCRWRLDGSGSARGVADGGSAGNVLKAQVSEEE